MLKLPTHSLLRSLIATIVLLGLLSGGLAAPATQPGLPSPAGEVATACTACQEFDRLNSLVRDSRIARAEAKRDLARLLPAIREQYYLAGGRDYSRDTWVFPLQGYTPRAIAGGRRHGFAPRGYDWFSGNLHGGHPAVDIFIRDRDQDLRDDRTGEYVPVLSVTGGIVIALAHDWQTSSRLRGGNYLWIYDPTNHLLVYYAHNRELAVGLGTIVKPGDRLALVGRSGWNAAKRRSPTHLHFTILHTDTADLVPEDPYPALLHSRLP
ncbi:MAG TPA: M23 family metallopeptidase [Geobacteraceae bacterium]